MFFFDPSWLHLGCSVSARSNPLLRYSSWLVLRFSAGYGSTLITLIQFFLFDLDWVPFDPGTLACPSTLVRLHTIVLANWDWLPGLSSLICRTAVPPAFWFCWLEHVGMLSSYHCAHNSSGIVALVFRTSWQACCLCYLCYVYIAVGVICIIESLYIVSTSPHIPIISTISGASWSHASLLGRISTILLFLLDGYSTRIISYF